MKPYEQGDKWWDRPGMHECGRGFNFHNMTLQHGRDSKFAKDLREKAAKRVNRTDSGNPPDSHFGAERA